MKTFDKIFFGMIFGAVFPIVLFLTGWWSTVGLVQENRIFIFAFSGLALGFALDFFLLKKIMVNLFNLNCFLLTTIYIFYSICIIGFFMGVPVFNLLLGIPAGYYVAKKCIYDKTEKEESEKQINRIARFTTYIIIFIAVLSASIALSDPYTVSSINGMFGLGQKITQSILYYIVILGGLAMIFVQYIITKYTARIVYFQITRK
jgi:hypothetical protein